MGGFCLPPATPLNMNTSSTVVGRVSIIIAAYNCAETIGATLESCLAQTYGNAEIIVVNDGSIDRTAEVLQTFGSKINIVNKCNGGLASARNAGARVATGEYMAWMDSDDLMVSDRIELQAGVLATDPAVELVSSDFSAFADDGADFEASHIHRYYSAVGRLNGLSNIYPKSREMAADSRCVTVRTGQAYRSLLSGNFVHPPTVMVRRSIFDRVGFFDEALRYNSDFDFILRAARIGCFAYIDTPLLRYRRSGAQMSHSAAGGKIPLETIKILEKVRLDDPDISLVQQHLFRRRFAELFTDAADLIGPSDRPRALRLLVRGVRHQLLLGAAVHAFVRIVVPRFVVVAAKSTWHHLTFGTK